MKKSKFQTDFSKFEEDILKQYADIYGRIDEELNGADDMGNLFITKHEEFELCANTAMLKKSACEVEMAQLDVEIALLEQKRKRLEKELKESNDEVKYFEI